MISIPETEFKLYEDGCDEKCKFSRKQQGNKLSKLIESQTDPIVLAVDAGWGAGKTHFLKCWAGQHSKEHENSTVVFFDAFQHDYLDDPLISLIAALDKRQDQSKNDSPAKSAARSTYEVVKKYGPALSKGTFKFGVNMLTAGALREIENADESLTDDIVKQLSEGAIGGVECPSSDKMGQDACFVKGASGSSFVYV